MPLSVRIEIMISEARTRFAPSPTGFLHIGGVRTALFNYLYAKQQGGKFILRLEDTDRERYVEEGVAQIVDSLEWLSLVPDDGFWISEGQHQNIEFVQSKRHEDGLYSENIDALLASGLAYRDWTTSKQLNELREQAKQEKRAFLFRRDMATTEGNESQPYVVRLDVMACDQLEGLIFVHEESGKKYPAVEWREPVRGNLHQKLVDIDDFILQKSDGFPTYNFANVIDDHKMQITHVLRGDEFIASTAKHILLYKALGFNEHPEFVHLPVINGTDGKKLSKRTGDTNTLDYRDKGYLPEALLSYLAQLGWNDATEDEIYNIEKLKERFRLDHIQKSPATFDEKRLEWVNGQFIRQLSTHELYEKVGNYWPDSAKDATQDYKMQILKLSQDRLKTLTDLRQFGYFFAEPEQNMELIENNKQLSKLPPERRAELIQQAKNALENSEFTPEAIQQTLNQLLETTGEKPGILFSLIRIYTTWAPFSPQLNDTLALLGREVVLKRLTI